MNSLHLPRLTKPPLDSPPFPIGTISLSLRQTANKPLFLIAFLSQFEEFFWLRSDFNVVNVKFAAWRRPFNHPGRGCADQYSMDAVADCCDVKCLLGPGACLTSHFQCAWSRYPTALSLHERRHRSFPAWTVIPAPHMTAFATQNSRRAPTTRLPVPRHPSRSAAPHVAMKRFDTQKNHKASRSNQCIEWQAPCIFH
jgi:hypothetical protein